MDVGRENWQRMRVLTAEDLTGQTFGKLSIVSMTDERVSGSVVFVARCECGETIKVSRQTLKSWQSSKYDPHCGCMGVGRGRHPAPGTLGVGNTARAHRPKNNPRKARNYRYLQSRHHAERRDIEWRLSRDQYTELTSKPCHYCGLPPSQIVTTVSGYHTDVQSGLDRLDSNLPYTTENAVPCCLDCNMAKHVKTVEQFTEWLQRVSAHWLGK